MTGASIRYGLLALVLGFSGLAVRCSPPAHVITPSAPPKWKTGYWVWAGEPLASARFMPDTVYVEAATRRWPRDLPAAAEYIVVHRMEPDAPLTPAAAMAIAERYDALLRDAGSRVRIVGLQIDYD